MRVEQRMRQAGRKEIFFKILYFIGTMYIVHLPAFPIVQLILKNSNWTTIEHFVN